MEGRAPRLGFRSGGARDAGDPHDSAAGVRQHGRHRALASADPPFNEKLLELLRPVGEPDAVARAPPPELEREAERRGLLSGDPQRLVATPQGQLFLNDLLQLFLP